MPVAETARDNDMIVAITSKDSHKNLGMVLEAFSIHSQSRPTSCLRIVGVSGISSARIIYEGWVDHAGALKALAGAKLAVFPSSVEAFGLPAFEAVMSGTLCIVANDSAMTEWLGDAVIGLDMSPQRLAHAMTEAMKGPELDPSVAANVRDKFSWERVVPMWDAAFRQAERCANE